MKGLMQLIRQGIYKIGCAKGYGIDRWKYNIR